MKIGLLLVDGFEDVEALAPKDLLERAGYSVELIAVNNQEIVTSSKNVCVLSNALYQNIHLEDYDLIILPGGPGVPSYSLNTKFIEDLKKRTNQKIAAICAAPTVLATCGLIKNKKVTCFPSVVDTLKQAGIEVVDEDVVVDDLILTSRAMGTSIDFGLAIIEWIENKEKADQIKLQICYKK